MKQAIQLCLLLLLASTTSAMHQKQPSKFVTGMVAVQAFIKKHYTPKFWENRTPDAKCQLTWRSDPQVFMKETEDFLNTTLDSFNAPLWFSIVYHNTSGYQSQLRWRYGSNDGQVYSLEIRDLVCDLRDKYASDEFLCTIKMLQKCTKKYNTIFKTTLCNKPLEDYIDTFTSMNINDVNGALSEWKTNIEPLVNDYHKAFDECVKNKFAQIEPDKATEFYKEVYEVGSGFQRLINNLEILESCMQQQQNSCSIQ